GSTMTEMFGSTAFPTVSDRPLFLSLGPYAFYWFMLEAEQESEEISVPGERRSATRVESFEGIFASASGFAQVERAMATYISHRHWFIGAQRRIRLVELADRIPIPGTRAQLLFLQVDFSEGDPDFYLLPVAVAEGEKEELSPECIITTLR